MRCLWSFLRPWMAGVLSCFPQVLALPCHRCRVNRPVLLTEGGTARGGQRAGPVRLCIPVGTSQGVLLKGGGAPCSGNPQCPPSPAPALLSLPRLSGDCQLFPGICPSWVLEADIYLCVSVHCLKTISMRPHYWKIV